MTATPKLRRLDVETMLTTEPPPVPWLAQPILARGCVTLLAGREGLGKSMVALALASAIGHGATVAGIDCRAGRTLCVDAENGPGEIHRRLRAMQPKPGTLTYFEAAGFSLAADIAVLRGLVAEHKPDLLVLDSLRSLSPGLDENRSDEAEAALRPIVNLAHSAGCAVLVLHHASRGSGEYRGSTAIGAAVELGFTLAREAGDPEARTRRRLSCWKSRPAAEPGDQWLALEVDDGRVLIGAAEPYEATQGDQGATRTDVRDRLVGVLELRGTPMRTAELFSLVGRDGRDSTAKRALREALDAGQVRRDADGNYSAARGRPAILDEADLAERAEAALRRHPDLAVATVGQGQGVRSGGHADPDPLPGIRCDSRDAG